MKSLTLSLQEEIAKFNQLRISNEPMLLYLPSWALSQLKKEMTLGFVYDRTSHQTGIFLDGVLIVPYEGFSEQGYGAIILKSLNSGHKVTLFQNKYLY